MFRYFGFIFCVFFVLFSFVLTPAVRDEPTLGPCGERRGPGGVHGPAGDGRRQGAVQAGGKREIY